METRLVPQQMSWRVPQSRLRQAGRGLFRILARSSFNGVTRNQISLQAREELGPIVTTLQRVMSKERNQGCNNLVCSSIPFHEVMEQTLGRMTQLVPKSLEQESLRLQLAFAQYPHKNMQARRVDIQTLHQFILELPRHVLLDSGLSQPSLSASSQSYMLPNGQSKPGQSNSHVRNTYRPPYKNLGGWPPTSQQPAPGNYQNGQTPQSAFGMQTASQNGVMPRTGSAADVHSRNKNAAYSRPSNYSGPSSYSPALASPPASPPAQVPPVQRIQAPSSNELQLDTPFANNKSQPSHYTDLYSTEDHDVTTEQNKLTLLPGFSQSAPSDADELGLTGRTDYKLFSRDHSGAGNGYEKLDLNIHASCLSEKYRLVVFDTETAGSIGKFQPQQSLVEIAAIDVGSGLSMQTLVNSEVPIQEGAMGVHHISRDMVEKPAVPKLREACMAFLDFVHSLIKDRPGVKPIICAHNLIAFDLVVMKYNFEQCGLRWPEEWMFLDSVLLARMSGSKRNKLGDLGEEFGIRSEGTLHHAMTDTKVLARVIEPLMSRIKIRNLDMLMAAEFKARVKGKIGNIHRASDYMDRARVRGNSASSDKNSLSRAELESPINLTEQAPVGRLPIDPGTLAIMPENQELDSQQAPSDWIQVLRDPYLEREFLDEHLATFKDMTVQQRKKLLEIKERDILTPLDVLSHFPRTHQHCEVRMEDDQYATVLGTVIKHKAYQLGRFQKTEIEIEVDPVEMLELDPHSAAVLQDDSFQIVRFTKMTQAFVAGRGKTATSTVPRAATDSKILMQGKLLYLGPGSWEMDSNANLVYDWHEGQTLPPLILPIYGKRAPVEHKDWKSIISKMLKFAGSSRRDPKYWDPLPQSVLQHYNLKPWFESMMEMHQPTTAHELESATRRLAFQELLFLQLFFLVKNRLVRESRSSERKPVKKDKLVKLALKQLPYKLTGSQDSVLKEILEDMAQSLPMLRLLQGDVGCGKTIVAFLALLANVSSGFQGVIMAPTEVVVEQHYQRLTELVSRLPEEQRPKIVKFSGPNCRGKAKREIVEGLADGSIHLVVGTTALVGKDAVYKKLGLAIIDEQHKFGVEQRAKLQAKADPMPHVLSMTATPIPRTMALVTQGDMAISTIDELPPNRQKVETIVIEDNQDSLDQMYADVRKEIKAGGRVFMVSSFIDESKAETLDDVRAANQEYEDLVENEVLGKNVGIGLLHGRLKSEEKEQAMLAFATGQTQVLVSTTLVEVGVDVPEASVMIINNSERFGLAQLHQLRGRVGRGKRKSKCYLVHADKGDDGAASQKRLSLMATEHNGLKLAEADLNNRGQGDVHGKQQSGKDIYASLKVAKLPEHSVLLEEARALAVHLVDTLGMDPKAWPTALLVAMSRQNLPKLDYSNLPDA